jgi:hypothetical protein
MPPTIPGCRGNVFTEPLVRNDMGDAEKPPTDFPLLRHRPHRKTDASNKSSIVASVFVSALNFSLSRCLAAHITDTILWEGLMEYVVEMGSDAMIDIPDFIKTGSGIQKLMYSTQTAW